MSESPRETERSRRWPLAVALAAALAAGGWTAVGLLEAVRPLDRLPVWDAAGNAWGAIELAAALADGRVLDFLARANDQDKWPFGYSLASLPFVAAGGGSRESAAWLPALAFALVPALLLLAGRELGRDRDESGQGSGLVAGALAGALWLAAPLPRVFATVAMRETTGAALTVAALAAYLAARRRGTLGAWRWLGGLLLALFWVKYNYFLLVGAGVGLHALLEGDPIQRRQRIDRLRIAVVGRGWRAPARWAALAGVATAATLAVGRNPGGALYGCLVVATVLVLSRRWKSLRLWMKESRARSPAARAMVETLVLPVWIWCLSPDPIHPRNILAFLRNRAGGGDLPPFEMLAFYPRAWVESYAAGPRLGIATGLLAAAGLVVLFRSFGAWRGEAARALALTAGVGAVLVTLHPMRDARFLATLAPLLYLLAAFAATRAAGAIWNAAARRSPPRSATVPLLAAVLVAPFYGAVVFARSDEGRSRVARDHRSLSADRKFAAPLAEIVRRVSFPGRRSVALVGGFNELSDSLVRWEAWRRHGREAPLIRPLRGLDGDDPPGRVRRRFAAWVERERPARVVTVRPFAHSATAKSTDYRRWNAWQETAIAALAEDRAWRPQERERSRGAEVEIVTWVHR